jgi:hypothetical protein
LGLKEIVSTTSKTIAESFYNDATISKIKTASKYIAAQIGKSGFKEALNYGVDNLCSSDMNGLKLRVLEKVELSLAGTFV